MHPLNPPTLFLVTVTFRVTRVLIHVLKKREEKTRWKLDRVKRIWYLSHMRAAKVQASLRIRAVSPEPSLLAHTSSESRGTFRQKARFLAPLNGWACAVKICHDGMFENTNSLDGAQLKDWYTNNCQTWMYQNFENMFITDCRHDVEKSDPHLILSSIF